MSSPLGFVYSVRVVSPDVANFLMTRVGDSTQQFEALIRQVMEDELNKYVTQPCDEPDFMQLLSGKPQVEDAFQELLAGVTQPVTTEVPFVSQPNATPVPCVIDVSDSEDESSTASTDAQEPAPSRKRRRTEIEEPSTEEVLQHLVGDHLVFTNDKESYVDLASLSTLLENVLADHYKIHRGAKTLINKKFKPTNILEPLLPIMNARGATFEKSIKLRFAEDTWNTLVDGDYVDGEVAFKKVFCGVALVDKTRKCLKTKKQ